MREQLLATRLDVLLRSANEVHSAVAALEASRKAVEVTKDELGQASLQASKLSGGGLSQLNEVLKRLRDELPEHDGTGGEALRQTIILLESLRADVPALVATLNKATDALGLHVRRYVAFEDDLATDVQNTTRELTSAIRTLLREVNIAATPQTDLWRTYSEEIAPTAEQLFSEYIDLLSGVAIRERGLAMSGQKEVQLDGLCRMADAHVKDLRQCVPWAKRTLTLPGRDASADSPSWPIARLGCAHWSIWGMPLEGHEFGKVAAGKELKSRAGEWADELSAFGANGLQLLVADMIGAWAEGPAYACALCFLRLDPRGTVVEPPRGRVSADERARVVASSLRQQIVPSAQPKATPVQVDGGYGYLDFVSGVFDRWHQAVEVSAVPGDDRTALLEALPGRVREDFELNRPFQVSDWSLSKDVWSALEQGQRLPDDPSPFIRHLMNAAWYARLSKGEESKLKPQEIERLVLAAGQVITDPTSRGRGSGRDQSAELAKTGSLGGPGGRA